MIKMWVLKTRSIEIPQHIQLVGWSGGRAVDDEVQSGSGGMSGGWKTDQIRQGYKECRLRAWSAVVGKKIEQRNI